MKKPLIAYFSASKVTEKLAKRLATLAQGDLYEIKPVTPYTKQDLDWMDETSRSSIEKKDLTSRPAIQGCVEDIDAYDVIYVGFPIWWYVAPTIINTFLEQYDLRGKTIIPFATSGSSGMGKTNERLKPSCEGAILKKGKRFDVNCKDEEIKAFLLN